MTRDELEAVIWRNWPARGPVAVRAVDAILDAADAYACHTGGITAERRSILRGAEPPVHYTEDPGGQVSVCGKITRAALSPAPMTTRLADVTCGSCKRTGNYASALATIPTSTRETQCSPS